MNRFAWVAAPLLPLSVLFAGCDVVSVAPVVAPGDAVDVPGLAGEWTADGGERITLTLADPGEFVVHRVDEDGTESTLRARSGRLGSRIVLDLWSEPPEDSDPLLLPAHFLLAINLRRDTVRTSTLDRDSLRAALVTGEVRTPYLEQEHRLVLTAPSPALRRALEGFILRPGALAVEGIWRRNGPAPYPDSGGGATGRGRSAAVRPPCFEASPWPAADSLFRRDPRWRGGDDAYSVALGTGRTLWLFADSWVAPHGGSRRSARMIRNSIAIQAGADPSTAEMTFYWGRAADGGARAFFERPASRSSGPSEPAATWLWPGHGARVGDHLILFFERLRRVPRGLGFQGVGWEAALVENPDDDPGHWRVRWLDTSPNPLGAVVGFGPVLMEGNHVYAYAPQETGAGHPLYLVRWPASDLGRGDMNGMEWWGGPEAGWVPDASDAARWPAMGDGQSELSVHYDSTANLFLAVQAVGFGPADVALRAAPRPEGPWSRPYVIFRPSEYHRPRIMIYAAKAHPELRGADLVFTYATNTFDRDDALDDLRIYFPRFVRLDGCR